MKRFSLAVAPLALTVALLSACGSAPQHVSGSSGADSFMSFSSSRSPRTIARCLTSRLSQVSEHTGPGYTELDVGRSASGYAWLVTLMPIASGSNVKVEKAVDDDSVSEPELRFAIARCTT
ncbi:sugar ABC transporter ATPase [Trinickia sp.]|uniref:sugar ABC transporter ATPase n=1 Tax=Trinickia sp. TaxID=2571163 RepID=UPI003F81C926